MELIIVWVLSILISYGAEMHLAFTMMKDIADNGYKIIYTRLKEVNGQIDLNTIKTNNIIRLLPIVNMIIGIKRASMYGQARYQLLDALSVMGVIEEMTEEEKKEYNENPTVIKAMKIIMDNSPEIKNVKTTDGSVIYFYNSDGEVLNNNNIVITKVKGPAKKLSGEEQINEVIKATNLISKLIENDVKNLKKLQETLAKRGINLEITVTKENGEKEVITIEPEEKTEKNTNATLSNLENNEEQEEKGKQKIYTKNNNHKF